MAKKELPDYVVEKDHRLESSAEKATEALAKLRWGWTLDESNPDRVSYAEYGRRVGRGEGVVRRYALGYAQWNPLHGADSGTLAEHIAKGGLSEEMAVAIEATVEVEGIAHSTARSTGRASEVLRKARQIAEEQDTEPVEVMHRAARLVQAERLRRQSPPPPSKPHNPRDWTTQQWDDFDRKVCAAHETIGLAKYLEDQGLYHPSAHAKLAAQLGSDKATDWDAELVKLTGGA